MSIITPAGEKPTSVQTLSSGELRDYTSPYIKVKERGRRHSRNSKANEDFLGRGRSRNLGVTRSRNTSVTTETPI